MFCHFSKTNNKEIVPLVIQHLKSLQEQIENYFPTVSTKNYIWVRNPILPLDTYCNSNFKEEEELIDIYNDGSIKLLHSKMALDEFWIKIQSEYPNIKEKALIILLQFSIMYLCKTRFSVLINLKTRKRERFLVEEEMQVALSNVHTDIERICSKNPAQISH